MRQISIPNNAFIARINPVDCKQDLLRELNTKLQFPYFGFNWDSLYDQLRDFYWIRQKYIFILHYGLSLPYEDYEIYLSVLRDSEQYWLNYPDEHILKFVFVNQSERVNGTGFEVI
jgi:hypothetical protein